jgi:AraC family transcriptional regulator of adaptative response / DNA-3-methyladenine glycosylase II
LLPVTRVAFASGFQSLRRFNDAFRTHYGMPPSAVRRPPGQLPSRTASADALGSAPLRLTLAYRAPLAWGALLAVLARDAIAGVDLVDGRRYARTVRIDGHAGIVTVEDVPSTAANCDAGSRGQTAHLVAHVSQSLVPALMPLLARLRHLLDLDAEPAAIDAHLTQGGLGSLVAARPGLRVPGAIDGFDVALRVILGARAVRIVDALGDRFESGIAGLDRITPSPKAIVAAGPAPLIELGVHARQARSLVAVARSIVEGTLQLEPGRNIAATHRTLAAIRGIGPVMATAIVARALDWPDAFATSDRALLARAESWRPWRAYAALHLRLARAGR